MNNKYANIAKNLGACKYFTQESVNEMGKVASCGTNPGFSDWLNIRRNEFSITLSIADVYVDVDLCTTDEPMYHLVWDTSTARIT